jgi:leucyl-tRNA synthetase
MEYNFTEIEKKWREKWQENKSYEVSNTSTKPKCYILDMFPYPSGAGLHVGHPLGYIASDIYARYKRLCGFNVLHPMGFDSFGLPAEQYALETGQHPAKTTEVNIDRYKSQLNNIGFCYDWSREVRTSDPSYYQWTQHIFSLLFSAWYNPIANKAEPLENLIASINANTFATISATDWQAMDNTQQQKTLMQYRLAYQAESYVNWCEALGTVLANDEVVNGISERGGHPVVKRLMTQWFLRITKYADRLLDGLEALQYPESLKEMQRNWIGKSIGAEVQFAVQHTTEHIKVFTTRPDTLFGVSFMVLAPELAIIKNITTDAQQQEVNNYISYVSNRSDIERMADKKISGAFTGAYAVHPFTGAPIPIWISEYVLAGYGTGAIMAVPAGDDRDFNFAKHFNITIPNIFEGVDISEAACTDKNATLCNSEFLNGLVAKDAIQLAIQQLQKKQIGKAKIMYKFRDAGFSRQRYWGEPFPIIQSENGVAQLVTELPVLLPHADTYSAGPNGKGPLANLTEWTQTASGIRETDTMPGFAGSSWYYLRYADPHNTTEFASRAATDYWNQVDVYIGGAEHAVGHLLYSRMWCKALYDLGKIGFDEPFKKVINQGMIGGSSRFVYRVKDTNHFVSAGLKDNYETTALHVDVNMCDNVELDIEQFKNWRPDYATATFELEEAKYICGTAFEKMSKSKYNVVNPDLIIEKYGADTFRMYEMFLGPIELSKPWDTKGIEGVHRFLRKCWRLFFAEDGTNKITTGAASTEELKVLHKHIKKITYDMEHFSFNTSIAQFMIVTNELSAMQCSKKEILEPLVITLAAHAPHIAEELFSALGNTTSVLDATFPLCDDNILVENNFTYPIAINGKARTELAFALDATAADIEATVLQNDIVQKWIEDKPIKKFIFVKGKMINVVV